MYKDLLEWENWEKRFDELFPTLSVSTKNYDGLGYDIVHRTPEVKDFIRTHSLSLIDQIEKEMKNMHQPRAIPNRERIPNYESYNMCLEDLQKFISTLRKQYSDEK